MKEFFTRSVANEGKKLPLYTPDGKVSEEYLKVLSMYSDTFRRAETKAKRELLALVDIKDDKVREAKAQAINIELVASLIVDWSFTEKCTKQNVCELLREAPQIHDAVNKFAAANKLFFAKKPMSSTNGQSESSD